jgi:WD40 repeat protein
MLAVTGETVDTLKSRVFISYARSDGEEVASALRDRLRRTEPEISVWQDRTHLEAGVGWWNQIAEAIAHVQFLVLVMTPAAMLSDVARKEWRYARQLGVCVYPVKGAPDHALDFASLPRWMRNVHFFDLDREWSTFTTYLKSPCVRHLVPFMAPDLPPTFVARPSLFNQLVAAVLASEQSTVTLTTSLQGAGGLGKTTLAAALCHDERMVEAFYDGILWATLGQEPKLIEELSKLYVALTGQRPTFLDEDDAAYHVARALEDKRCLLVVDDVWSASHLTPFMRGGKNCARVITTRRSELATDTARLRVDEMRPSEAAAMLGANLPEAPGCVDALLHLARRLGEWPLLLKLVNSQIRQRLTKGDDVIAAIEHMRMKLDRLGIFSFDARNPSQRNEAMSRSIGLSFDALALEDQKLCAMLAAFPEDVDVPLAVIAELWSMDDFLAEEIVFHFDDVSLVSVNAQNGTVKLHDVIRSYLATRAGEIRGLHSRIADVLERESMSRTHYAWTWRAHHLVEAGRAHDVQGLLLDIFWLVGKLHATDAGQLLAEFAAVAGSVDMATLHDAIRLAGHAVSSDVHQLPGQLLARLPQDRTNPVITAFTERVRSWRAWPWLQPAVPLLTPAGGALAGTLTGHRGGVAALAVPGDGRRLVSASRSGEIFVWDWLHGRLEQSVSVHGVSVTSVDVHPDTGTVVFASEDGEVRAWSPETGTERVVGRLPARPSALALDPGPNLIIHAAAGGRLFRWSEDSNGFVALDVPELASVTHVAALAEGRIALTLRGWDVLEYAPAVGEGREWPCAHQFPVEALAVHRRGRLAASLDQGGRVVLTSTSGMQVESREITMQARHGACVAVGADPPRVVVGGDDGCVRVWNALECREIAVLGGHVGPVNAVCITPDEKVMMSGGDDRTIRIWKAAIGAALPPESAHAEPVYGVTFSPDERRGFSVSASGHLVIWDTASANRLAEEEGDRSWLADIDGSGRFVVVALPGGRLHCFARDEVGGPDFVFNTTEVCAVKWEIAPGYLCALNLRNPSEYLDATSRHVRVRLRVGASDAKCADITTDGRVMVTSPDRVSLARWTFEGGRRAVMNGRLRSLCVSEDGVRLACGADDGSLALLDEELVVVRTWARAHEARINAVHLSADGRYVASAGDDHQIRLWDSHAEGDAPMCAFVAEAPVTAVSLGPGADSLVAGDHNGLVHFFTIHR